LPDVGGLLEQEPAAPGVEQVHRQALKNAKASLEEIRKRSEEDKAVWQRERDDMKRQVNRLQEEVLAAANAKASLEEIRMQQNAYSARESPTKVGKTTYQLRENGKEVDEVRNN
jgi:carbonic anhydrase